MNIVSWAFWSFFASEITLLHRKENQQVKIIRRCRAKKATPRALKDLEGKIRRYIGGLKIKGIKEQGLGQ